jgi:tetratricopeptide (TPR) repeat protein
MSRGRILVLFGFGWSVLVPAGPLTASPETGTERAAESAPLGLSDAASTAPVELAPMTLGNRTLSEAELSEHHRRRVEALSAEFDATSDPITQALAALAAAEYVLARQIEPALSLELLGLTTAEDRRFISQRARQALDWLEKAEARLHNNDEDVDVEDSLYDRLEAAQAFAGVFIEMCAEETEDESEHEERVLTACRRLALLLDAPDEALAASARLWQGAVYRRAGRADRAVQVLPRALARPGPQPFDFFARLERCAALADTGRYAAAMALTNQEYQYIKRRLAPEEVRSVELVITRMQSRIWRDWAEALQRDGQEREERAARQYADEAEARLRTAASRGVFRLGHAIGGVEAPLEEPDPPPAAPELDEEPEEASEPAPEEQPPHDDETEDDAPIVPPVLDPRA